jgi:hypothetical protein
MTMRKIVLSWLFLILFSTVAAAQSAPAKDNEGFEPVNGDMMAKGESIPASRLVGGAYGFIFAAVVVYVGSVTSRLRRVEDEVDGLKRQLEQKGIKG